MQKQKKRRKKKKKKKKKKEKTKENPNLSEKEVLLGHRGQKQVIAEEISNRLN